MGSTLTDKSFHNDMRGSPPYTWGAHLGEVVGLGTNGITPIYMGST